MEAKAEARYIRISPQKARLVVDLIRGQSAGQARTTLSATNKRIAPTVRKVLDSAIANARDRLRRLTKRGGEHTAFPLRLLRETRRKSAEIGNNRLL